MHSFSTGFLAAVPTGANPTPVPFAIIEDVSIDISRDLKKLRGQNKHVVAVGEAGQDVTGKVGSASFFGSAMATILGGTAAAGSDVPIIGETGTIPTTPFQITAAQGATFKRNYGVLDLTTGKMMARGATATGTGVYAVNEATGVYTFNTADSGHKVSLVYTYTAAAVGQTVAVVNSVMNIVTGVMLAAYGPKVGTSALGFVGYNVHFPKLGFNLKVDDFAKQNAEFFCAQSATSDAIYDLITPE
jgi:hypothetical protein